MPRLLFPADRTAYVYTALGAPILVPTRSALTIYADESANDLADIQNFDHARIINSTIYTDEAGLIPEFFGPLSITRLWAKPVGGPAYPLDANYGVRIDSLETGGVLPGSTNTILSGEGLPNNTYGIDGDWYIDELAHTMVGPKFNGTWPAPVSMVGPQGVPGPGGIGQSFTHQQFASEDTWNITHPLPFIPNVSVVDSAGTVVHGDIRVLTPNQIQLRFSAPFSGSAFLS